MKSFARLVEIAKAMKPAGWRGRSFHVSFVLQKSKVVAVGTNSYHKRNRICLTYKPQRASLGGNPYIPSIHSEIEATAKVKFSDFDNFTLVNIRVNNNGQLANSCPCANCAFHLGRMTHITKVFYSNNEGGFNRFP
jgi:deoxycytidylate deaminase